MDSTSSWYTIKKLVAFGVQNYKNSSEPPKFFALHQTFPSGKRKKNGRK